MRKVLFWFLVINILPLIAAPVIAYFYVNEKVAENYTATFNNCKEQYEAVGYASVSGNKFATDCFSKNGCYANFCGAMLYDPAPSLTVGQFLNLAKKAITKDLPKETTCKDYCLMPP